MSLGNLISLFISFLDCVYEAKRQQNENDE